ncbi:MAG: DUF1501 domain-containing protein [Planctomycetes bacterium]|nr:DUF1501 domain-containing protein [Planctomycetota bacterium]
MQTNRIGCGRITPAFSRREMLLSSGAGFGALALSYLLRDAPVFGQTPVANTPGSPLSARRGHFAARAKSVIFCFMEGGPSHLDTFDPKPLVNRLAGQRIPDSFRPVITPMGEFYSPILASRRRWARHGQSGLWVSDWLPHIATCADDLAVIRSCWANGLNHSNGVSQMNTGSIVGGRPSLGAWVTYGLGTENENLPAFVVMQDNAASVNNGARNWGTGFMPAVYQGTRIHAGAEPIPHLNPPAVISPAQQRGRLDLLNALNQDHARSRHAAGSDLEARIASYELAYRMQAQAPEAVDLTQETRETQNLYGIDDPLTATYGRMCLLGRRLVERGVRFVQLFHGSGSKWDAHRGIETNHATNCRGSDKPIAGLLKDLKRRGLLDSTLVIWGGEFGRTPQSEQGDGRDHNPYGFTMWMAGGGVRGGQVVGSTDEVGLHAVEDRLHVHDLHATILYLLGLDHTRVIYRHQGRPERATVNEGEAFTRIAGT